MICSVPLPSQGAELAMRHRMILNFEAEADGKTTDDILKDFKEAVPRQETAAAG